MSETLIQHLAGIGCTNKEIAAVSGVCDDTLVANYSDSIEKGRQVAKMSLRRKQWLVAHNSKDPSHGTMLIWLGKQLLGQSDKSEKTVTRNVRYGLGDNSRTDAVHATETIQ